MCSVLNKLPIRMCLLQKLVFKRIFAKKNIGNLYTVYVLLLVSVCSIRIVVMGMCSIRILFTEMPQSGYIQRKASHRHDE